MLEIDQHNQTLAAAAAESPVMATIANIGGSLVGGMADPVGIIGGSLLGAAGTAVAARVVSKTTQAAVSALFKATNIIPDDKVTTGLLKVSTQLASGKAYKGLGGAALGATETVVGIAALDLPALKMNRELYGEHLSTTEAVAMIVGGGMLGGAMGAAIGYKGGLGSLLEAKVPDAKMNEMARKTATYAQLQYGDDAFDAMVQTAAHNDTLAKIGVKENPNYVSDMYDDITYSVRGGQDEYNYIPKKSAAEVKDSVFYASKYSTGKFNFSQNTTRGYGAVEFSDAKHLKENIVKDLDNKGKGVVATVKPAQDANIFDESPENLMKLRAIVSKGIKTVLGDSTSAKEFFPETVQDAVDFLSTLDGVTDSPTLFNRIIAEAGFDGYATAGTNSKGIPAYNSLVMLDKAALGIEGGDKAVYGDMDFNPSQIQKLDESEIPDVDMNDPKTAGVAESIKKQKAAEITRMDDPTQRMDYVPEAERAVTPEQKALVGSGAEDDIVTKQAEMLTNDINEVFGDMDDKIKIEMLEKLDFIKDKETFGKLKENFATCSIGKVLGNVDV